MLKINQINKVKEGHKWKCGVYRRNNGKYIRITEKNHSDYYEILGEDKKFIGWVCGCFTEDDLELEEEKADCIYKNEDCKICPKQKSLKQLIEDKNFDRVNSDITKNNFSITKREHGEYKLYHFDKLISSEDALKEMEKDGYSPATLLELLEWNDWNNKDWVVALGSVCELDGGRRVAGLWCDGDVLGLDLFDWSGDWGAGYGFLSVRTLPIKPLEDLEVGDEMIKKLDININNKDSNLKMFLYNQVELTNKINEIIDRINVKSLSTSEAETLLEEKLSYKVKIK